MRRGSTTFFNSSLFFPAGVRRDVVTLYAFVRTADDFVDSKPQDARGFYEFRDRYRRALESGCSDDEIIGGFAKLSKRHGFQSEWVESFLAAMEQDLTKSIYLSMNETESYMRGSAEAVGLMMARIMSLADAALPYAAMLGKAFQYLNFIRDIKEDLEMNRVYIPQDQIARAGLPNLSLETALGQPRAFENLIRDQLCYYRFWRREGAEGYKFIPRRYLVAIKTASDVFDTTADVIEKDPLTVLKRKVKAAKAQVIAMGLRNLVVVGLAKAYRTHADRNNAPDD